jgi:hypothetical protein
MMGLSSNTKHSMDEHTTPADDTVAVPAEHTEEVAPAEETHEAEHTEEAAA